MPSGCRVSQEIRVDGEGGGVHAAVSVLTALLFGALPSLQSSKGDVNEALKGGARGAPVPGPAALHARRDRIRARGRAARRRRAVRAELLARAACRTRLRTATRADGAAVAAAAERSRPGPLLAPRTGHQARLATYEEILRRAGTLPGVTAAAAAESLPLDGTRSSVVFTAEGSERDDRSKVPTAQINERVGEIFRSMGIRMLRGRTFNDQDDGTAAPVVIVTESIAGGAGRGRIRSGSGCMSAGRKRRTRG